jgi:lipopolysaccharide transport system ATP-binding protein
MAAVIRAENLCKCYRINHADPGRRERTLLGDLARLAGRPLRRLWGTPADQVEEFWALKGVSFEVEQGEVFGIIGKNGAGKSTLLKILSQITRPTAGRVRVRGRLSSLLEVGTGFHPELTGRENVYLNGSILGMSRREVARKFDQIVAFAEVEQFLDTPVKRYSSGMYVRLAFAVAAHLEPDILVVDEVLAVGDDAFQQKCLGEMGNLRRSGRTILVVSHSMVTVMNLCQRVVLLHAGQVLAVGPPAPVVQQYLGMSRTLKGEVVWPDPDQAPGNEVARLHAVRIRQEGIDGPTGEVDICREVLVEISYWNLVEGAQLYSGLWLKDALGTFILATSNEKSISLTDDPWYRKPLPRGLFRSACRIPANFLNEGRYAITAIVGKIPNQTIVLEESVITFEAHDTGAMREVYYGPWVGPVIRPRLAWHTEYSGNGLASGPEGQVRHGVG